LLESSGVLERLDAVVVNHAEPDHSAALVQLMRLRPDLPIYCSKRGEDSITGYYHSDWELNTVSTGDTLSIGKRELTFVEATMLHWPDTMFTHLSGQNILFSNDGFGQHYASENLFAEREDQTHLFDEAMKYYANILTPFNSAVKAKLKELLDSELAIDMIAPSHGLIWREPQAILEKYRLWCDSYSEDQVTIAYDTMWESTRMMAEAIAEGIRELRERTEIKIMHTAGYAKSDILAQIFRSKVTLFGSPTVNNGILPSMAGLIEEVRGHRMRDKGFATFGSYGWSGEAVAAMGDKLQAAGLNKLNDGLRLKWRPDAGSLDSCKSFGKEIAGLID